MRKTLKFLKRDINYGIVHRWHLFLLPVLLAFVQVKDFQNCVIYFKENDLLSAKVTTMDCFMFCVRGMAVFHFDPKVLFSIPIFWFVFQIGISYIIAYYAYNDFLDNGRNLFIASRSRASWWISKCIWCVQTVLMYYLIYMVSVFYIACCYGADLSTHFTLQYMLQLFGLNMEYLSYGDSLYIAVLLPVVVTLAICCLQMLVSFILTPVISLATACGLYVISAYYTNGLLIGSYTMWMRSSYYTENGVAPLSGLVLGGSIIMATVVAGKKYFRYQDIF